MKNNRKTLIAYIVVVLAVVVTYIGHIYSANAQGAINPQTGEFYPTVPHGAISPQTGEFYPGTGGGYINPRTGDFYPGTSGNINPNTGMPYQGFER